MQGTACTVIHLYTENDVIAWLGEKTETKGGGKHVPELKRFERATGQPHFTGERAGFTDSVYS